MKYLPYLLLLMSIIVPDALADDYYLDLEAAAFQGNNIFKTDSGAFSGSYYVMGDEKGCIKVLIKNHGIMKTLTQVELKLTIRVEDENGDFNDLAFANQCYFDMHQEDSTLVNIPIYDAKKDTQMFFPETFRRRKIKNQAIEVPDRFSTMYRNVTPLYKIRVELQADQDTNNNVIEDNFRFYLPGHYNKMLLSLENSYKDIENSKDPDEIAGRLNSDSLLGVFKSEEYNFIDYDVFERTSWPIQAFDYSYYNTVIWSDGDDKAMDEQSQEQLKRFFDKSPGVIRKNIFVICSQDFAREMSKDYENKEFLNTYFGIDNAKPGNPLGESVSNEGNYMYERSSLHHQLHIKNTDFESDAAPYCGLLNKSEESNGISEEIFFYNEHPVNDSSDIAAIRHETTKYHAIIYAADWRHFSDTDYLYKQMNENSGLSITLDWETFHLHVSPENIKIMPGDTLNLNLHMSHYTSSTPNPGGRLISLENTMDYCTTKLVTDEDGNTNYTAVIPEDLPLGEYEIYFSYRGYQRYSYNGSSWQWEYEDTYKKILVNVADNVEEVKSRKAASKILIYPNPADDKVNIVIPEEIQQWEINIYNTLGIKVISDKISSGLFSIGLEKIVPGIYIIEIKTEKSIYTNKLIIN